MSARALAVVDQPCILCEETLLVMTLMRDDESGHEEWLTEAPSAPHDCLQMRLLRAERTRPF